MVTLNSGEILYAYTRFEGERGGDDAPAVIASRRSADNGQTWTAEDTILVANEGRLNVMSASLLKLQDGRIALFYLRKEDQEDVRAFMRLSDDDAATWSEPTCCVPVGTPGAFITNNDRVIQLASGRLIVPASYGFPLAPDPATGKRRRSRQFTRYFYSDDIGRTWAEGNTCYSLPVPDNAGMQEAGAVELRDGRLFGWGRTGSGCQWGQYSHDSGVTWFTPFPTCFTGPLAPLSIKRIPSSGHLLAVWNHHDKRYGLPKPGPGSANRTPLAAATSADDGITWANHRLIENDPHRAFTYIAIHPTDDDHILLAYGTGVNPTEGLRQRVRRIAVKWFLEDLFMVSDVDNRL